MATVNLCDVSKFHGQQLILDTINLSVISGEFLVIVGPSGCGKSTLLRLIAGLDEITHGQILINDKCINNMPAHRRDIAMVFQNYALYPHMTVFENMAYGLKLRGMKSPAIEKKVLATAQLLQLNSLLSRKPQALSGGQRQRVAMGRAIVREPALFLFDEPLSNLDTTLRGEMRYEIKKLHQQLQVTSLYVTHDQTEAMTMASRIVVLNKGKIEQIDTPQTVYQKPASLFVAGFLGVHPLNLIPGKLKEKKFVSDWGFNIPLPPALSSIDNEQVILAIRPEHVKLHARTNQHALPVTIEFVDDMGADKLIHVVSQCGGYRWLSRVTSEYSINSHEVAIELDYDKANLFDKNNGLRLGGWM